MCLTWLLLRLLINNSFCYNEIAWILQYEIRSCSFQFEDKIVSASTHQVTYMYFEILSFCVIMAITAVSLDDFSEAVLTLNCNSDVLPYDAEKSSDCINETLVDFVHIFNEIKISVTEFCYFLH